MLQHLEEYGTYAEITGYRSVKFSSAEGFLKGTRKQARRSYEVQFFDASVIATAKHLYFAALNALEAFKSRTNISKSLAMEVMLYASAQRQIQKAIQHCGINPQTTSMAAIIICRNPTQIKRALDAISRAVAADPDETVLEMAESKLERIKQVFQISDDELKAVAEDEKWFEAAVSIVVERVALLATQL